MQTIPEEITEIFLSRLETDPLFGSKAIQGLRNILASEKKIRKEELLEIFKSEEEVVAHDQNHSD